MLERIWREGNPSPLLMGVQTCTVSLDISMAVSQTIGISLPQDLEISFFGIYLKDA